MNYLVICSIKVNSESIIISLREEEKESSGEADKWLIRELTSSAKPDELSSSWIIRRFESIRERSYGVDRPEHHQRSYAF